MPSRSDSARRLCDELIPRPEEFYRLWCVVMCVLENLEMRKPWPTGACCTKRKKIQSHRWHAVAQLVEVLRYKSESRRFDSRWCHWNFSLPYFFRPHYGPGVDSASKRNEYQEYFLVGEGGRSVGLTILQPSYSECHEICKPQPPGTQGPVRACTSFALPFILYSKLKRQIKPVFLS